MNSLPLVLVIWLDAWVRADEPVSLTDVALSHKPTKVHTLGWLLQDDAIGVSLANEEYDGTFRGRTFIPRAMIETVERHKLAKARVKSGQQMGGRKQSRRTAESSERQRPESGRSVETPGLSGQQREREDKGAEPSSE